MKKSTEKCTSASSDSSLEQLVEQHHALLAQVANIGLVLRGSIAQRRTRCGQKGCRCQSDPSQLHGPYYLWTRKVAGKTVTAQLPPDQAASCLIWNKNMRQLDHLVQQLQEIGLQAANLVRNK